MSLGWIREGVIRFRLREVVNGNNDFEMKSLIELMKKADRIDQILKTVPHLVILGAGASCAALPNGDLYGKKISAMNGFIEKLGLEYVISGIDLRTSSDNLEDIYMELDERAKNEPICLKAKNMLEDSISEYMREYVLPKTPTVYDFLLMSLTSKDLIATFNWDPLLVQTVIRWENYGKRLPEIVFLHGNVGISVCPQDGAIAPYGATCHRCGGPLKPSKLLYPIKNKDYTSDKTIEYAWARVRQCLKCAYILTIFGYSAPKSDVEAVSMMRDAWTSSPSRQLSQTEIIDIKSSEDLSDSWSDFIYSHHYSCHKSFFTSTLAKYPRRSCEAFFDMIMNLEILDESCGFSEDMDFADIYRMTYDLVKEENEKDGREEVLSDPYIKK